MKKKWMTYMLAGVLAVYPAGGMMLTPDVPFVYAAAETTGQESSFDARAYVEILFGQDTKSLEEDYSYTEEFVSAIESSGGFAGLQNSLKALGALKDMGDSVVVQDSGYTMYSVPCEFEAMKLNIAITLDAEGKIAGVVTAQYQEPDEKAELPEGVAEEELALSLSGEEGWELPGTLTLPEGEGPFPAVVLVHGSGPNDRDESIGPNKPFRDLAWGLAQQGIAVYRYDKRTKIYAAESAADTELTLNEETVEDAGDAVRLVRGQAAIDPDRVYVLGHSLGGEALPRIDSVLEEDGKAAGYIFLAAPARRLPDIMKEQYDYLYSFTPELSEEEQLQKETVYEELASLQNPEKLQEDKAVMGAYKAYWEDLNQYDPVEKAKAITSECLVLQGEEDYQVTMEDYTLWKDAFGDAENWTFISYSGLTHLFMEGSLENGSGDYMNAQNVDARVVEDIAEFVKD